MSTATGTIDDKFANDPAHGRLIETSEQARNIATDLEPHFKDLIGKPATGALASEAVKILYDAGLKGEAPVLIQILERYGVKSPDHQTTIALYGIPREELMKDIVKEMKDGKVENFSIADILRIAQTLANRYQAKTLEAEPTRLTNLASKYSVKPILNKMIDTVRRIYGEAAEKAERIKQASVTSVQDFAQYAQQFYGDSFRRYSTATAR